MDHLEPGAPPAITVRLGRAADAPALWELWNRSAPAQTGELDPGRLGEQLALEPGEDYFTLVAETLGTAAVVAWLAAGGCRGQEHKGWAEIYTICTTPDAPDGAELALIDAACDTLGQAGFAGVVTRDRRGSTRCTAALAAAGFLPEAVGGVRGTESPAYLLGFTRP